MKESREDFEYFNDGDSLFNSYKHLEEVAERIAKKVSDKILEGLK